MKQRTLTKSFSLQGIGLHTGEQVEITCNPAEPGHGIVFQRIDLEDKPLVPAQVTNVFSTNRSTDIRRGEATIHTTEHLLSAFFGQGVSNALIEIKGPEVPIIDGSAKPFVEAIQSVGVVEQESLQEHFELDEIVTFKDPKSGSEYTYFPVDDHADSEISAIIEYDGKVGRQVATYDANTAYASEIAGSRTFVFVNELEELYNHGVIKGGRVNNAIVFNRENFPSERISALAKLFNVKEDITLDNGILNGLELHFPNEPARHKLLDLLGDLYLLRMPIKGKIMAKRPGHTGNVAFAKHLRELHIKRKKLKGKPKYVPGQEVLYDIEKIKTLIPHRYPFLLVDSILELKDDLVVGIKNVTGNENFFQGHFPDNPVFPGVLQMEALAQTGGILALSQVEEPELWDTYFIKMEAVKFKKIVRPGDTIILKMELLSPIRRGIVHMQGTAYVGDAIVSEGELTAQIIKRS